MRLVIRNAQLRSTESPADIGLDGGRIVQIAPRIAGKAETELDAAGRLVTESYANPHLHLCKVYTLQMEVAFLAVHMLWMTTAADMEHLYDMITVDAARAMGLADFELKVGAPAHLVILNAPNVLEALREHAAPATVISHGQIVEVEAMRAIIRENE